MNLQLNSNTDKYAKVKMGLIPVLLLGFAYVIFAPESKPTTPAPVVATTKVSTATTTVATELDQKSSSDSTLKIPNISLAETTAYDPFELLPILRPKPKVEPKSQTNIVKNDSLGTSTAAIISDIELEKQKKLAEAEARIAGLKTSINQLMIQGIFASGNKRSVLINSRIFREGDTLTEGVKILKINSRDVVLDIENTDRIRLK